MVSYPKRFLSILKEAKDAPEPEINTPEVNPVPTTEDPAGKEAFNKTLDPGTNPSKFDVPPVPLTDNRVMQVNQEIREIQQWIDEVEKFTDRLNGLNGSSIQSRLNSATKDTIFEPIARSETKKISRIAQDLRGLSESLKGHLMSADTGG